MKRLERIDGAKYERNYVYNFHYHLIWVTKYRKAVFIECINHDRCWLCNTDSI